MFSETTSQVFAASMSRPEPLLSHSPTLGKLLLVRVSAKGSGSDPEGYVQA